MGLYHIFPLPKPSPVSYKSHLTKIFPAKPHHSYPEANKLGATKHPSGRVSASCKTIYYRQRILTENDIPRLMMINAIIEQVTEFNFLGLTVNEHMNWNSHTQKIANRISHTLERYLPFSAMKFMYDSLILSHLQFGITNWGFERERISKLQKRVLRIMKNSRYNPHTEPLFKKLNLLKR